MFPKGEYYLVPIKDAVRKAERLELGDTVTIRLHLDASRGRLIVLTGARRSGRSKPVQPDRLQDSFDQDRADRAE